MAADDNGYFVTVEFFTSGREKEKNRHKKEEEEVEEGEANETVKERKRESRQ